MSESGNNSQQSAESLLSEELSSYCNSNSLSKEGLQEIIERHDYKNRQVSDYKFFLWACINKRVNEGIIQCLLEYFPDAISATSYFGGQTPLHYACYNPHMTVNIVQLLVDAAPNSVSHADNNGETPLHRLSNNVLDDTKAIKILKLLIDKCPEAIRHANNGGILPIHIAGGWGRRSTEFCSVLIEAYPGSQRMTDANGLLPLYYACAENTLAMVEYLYKLYPDAINQTTTRGLYPIHNAILGVIKKTKSFSPSDRLGIVRYLLDCDPNVTLQKVDGESLLKWACRKRYNDSTIAAALKVIETIYDAYPEAIEENRISSDIQRYHEQVQTFINTHLVYSRQAKNLRLMMTPDSNGRLPLHTALQNNVRLGSIKLLVKGNPSAIRNADINFAKPLHIACQHHESADVIQYLIGFDTSTLDAVDKEGGTALHYACCSAKYDTIALLLEKYDAVSVSKRNAHGKLPIDLLWESNEVLNRDSEEYTESVFRLLKAYPEAIIFMNIDMQQQQSALDSCPSQNGKKRKFVMTNER